MYRAIDFDVVAGRANSTPTDLEVQLDAAAEHLTATLGRKRYAELAARGRELDVPQLLATAMDAA
jgi:hypothetical protein